MPDLGAAIAVLAIAMTELEHIEGNLVELVGREGVAGGAVLPEQLSPPPRNTSSGTCRLMAAVLEEAIASLLAGGRPSVDAEDWIRSTDRSWPFAFESVCDVLDLDSERLRRTFLRAPVRAMAAREAVRRGRRKTIRRRISRSAVAAARSSGSDVDAA